MVKGKKVLTSTVVASLLFSSSLEASWKTYAEGKIAVQNTNPTSIKTSVGRTFSGGGLRVRWGSLGTITPIHAEAPSMSVGCNGIDIRLGSISFLEFDELVDKLKMIASAAPAFAFKMAIDTVCSQCSTIMQDLSDAVDAINNMSLDSCQAAQALGGGAGKALGNAMNEGHFGDAFKTNKEVGRSGGEDKASESMLRSFANKAGGINLNKKLEALLLHKKFGFGSVIDATEVNSNTIAGEDAKELLKIVRALVGDIYLYKKSGAEKNTIDNLYPTITVHRLIQLLSGAVDGDIKLDRKNLLDQKNNIIDQKTMTVKNRPYNISEIVSTTDSINQTNNWATKTKIKLAAVMLKLKNKSKLSNEDKQLLTALPGNGYKIMVAYSQQRGAMAKDSLEEDEYYQYIALVNIRNTLREVVAKGVDSVKLQLSSSGGFGESDNEELIKAATLYVSMCETVIKEINNDDTFKVIPKLESRLNSTLLELRASRVRTLDKE